MPHAREDHRDAVPIAGVDGILIADASARLDDAADSRLCAGLHAVVKREEGVARQRRATHLVAAALDGHLRAPYAVDLPRPDAQTLVILRNRNAVGFGVLDDLPRQHQILHLLGRRLRLGDDLQFAVLRQQLVVDLLHQQAARHLAHHALALGVGADRRIQLQQAQVLLLGQNRQRLVGE